MIRDLEIHPLVIDALDLLEDRGGEPTLSIRAEAKLAATIVSRADAPDYAEGLAMLVDVAVYLSEAYGAATAARAILRAATGATQGVQPAMQSS